MDPQARSAACASGFISSSQSSFEALFPSSSSTVQASSAAAGDGLFVGEHPSDPIDTAFDDAYMFTPPPSSPHSRPTAAAQEAQSMPPPGLDSLPATVATTAAKQKTRAAPKTNKANKTNKTSKTNKGTAAAQPAKPRQPPKNPKPKAPGGRKRAQPKAEPEPTPESRLLVPPLSLGSQTSARWGCLEETINSGSPQAVAQAVGASRPLLGSLLEAIGSMGSDNSLARDWAYRVRELAQAVEATTTASRRLLIGVVGRTGTGKSSVINAILDETRMVPTNGLRACTAVVTEIAWNASDDPAERYRAEIEFVQPETWQSDVVRLYDDLGDALQGGGGSGGGSGDADDDAQSSIALAKLRTVFPQHIKGKHSILSGECTVDMLLDDPGVSSLLGTVRTVKAADSEDFYDQLKAYLDTNVISSRDDAEDNDDSDELGLGKAEEEPPNECEQRGSDTEAMQLWPLIKVVRIYTKADVLSTGVVLVDLPGFGDANMARDALAEGYLSQCSALWVISPITRAVDDKEARALLDRSFKRQLVLEGSLDNLTFVCSKTDDIEVRETAESLSSAGQAVAKIDALLASLEAEIKSQAEKLATMHQVHEPELRQKLSAAEKELDELVKLGWSALEQRSNGEEGSGSEHAQQQQQQQQQLKRDPDEAFSGDAADGPAAKRLRAGEAAQDLCEARLREQVKRKDTIAEKLRLLQVYMEAAEERYSGLEADKHSLVNERVAVCMQLRNEYSRKRIKQDFAQGQKELDEEAAVAASGKRARRSAKGKNAKGKTKRGKKAEPARDYAALARNLPVFCVSSRAYQDLRGRDDASLSADREREAGDAARASSRPAAGYRTIDETEIPRLRQHAKNLSAGHALQRGRAMLQGLLQLLASLAAWSGGDGNAGGLGGFGGFGGFSGSDGSVQDVHLDPGQEEHLRKTFLALRTALSEATDKLLGSLASTMETKVLAKMSQLVLKAQVEAPRTVAVWARPRSKGGVTWQSYRSICRNKGNKTASRASRPFNDELVGPLLDGLLPTWTAAFNVKVPAALAACQAQMAKAVDRFQRDLRPRRPADQVLVQAVRGVRQQLQRAVEAAGQAIEAVRRAVIQQPRACICAAMEPVYEYCAREAGKGCLQRMRDAMQEHVAQNSEAMYAQMEALARAELAQFVQQVLPAGLPSKPAADEPQQLPAAGASSSAGAGDDDAVVPDQMLQQFYGACRCMLGRVEGGVPEAMQSAQESIREVLDTVAGVFSFPDGEAGVSGVVE